MNPKVPSRLPHKPHILAARGQEQSKHDPTLGTVETLHVIRPGLVIPAKNPQSSVMAQGLGTGVTGMYPDGASGPNVFTVCVFRSY